MSVTAFVVKGATIGALLSTPFGMVMVAVAGIGVIILACATRSHCKTSKAAFAAKVSQPSQEDRLVIEIVRHIMAEKEWDEAKALYSILYSQFRFPEEETGERLMLKILLRAARERWYWPCVQDLIAIPILCQGSIEKDHSRTP